ncbi:hypothetical protein CANINC_001079 [Pichia inconspicua]|uniref:UBA domain-containing protein n=1 Tax=Pichia inconspicua TaxID=52247 RepID=A0A4T0X5U0_9ASCO|nr:hypothetical protein CANINC_001079 [[Candida] inconspicua]
MSDLFADLLKDVSLGNSNKNADSNLSLNEKMSASKTASKVNDSNRSNLDLDFLDTYMQKSSSNIGVSKSNTFSDSNDLFFSQNVPAKAQRLTEIKPVPKPTECISKTTNLLDDVFELSDNAGSLNNRSPALNSFVIPPSPKKASHIPSQQEMRDAALAELLDMGFPIEKATNALKATESGCDVNSAISILMDAAHKSTRHIPQSSTIDYNEPDLINEISSNIISTATLLFNSGKKKIQQGVEMYRKQKLENDQGIPRWMKNQQQYKNNSMKLSDWNEGEDEMDEQTMRRILKRQGQRENVFEQKDFHEKGQSTASPSLYKNVKSLKIDDNRNISHETKDRLKSNTEKYAKSILVKPSSTSPSQNIQPAEEIDLLGGFSSLKPQNSFEFSIPLLDSAQRMAFTHSREIAQENFKTGDFTKSLEFYIEAGNVIPSDHPYQVIICSNLTLLYSKLGNAKEQLKTAERGLELIDGVMTKQKVSISDLSNLKFEDGKSLKSFWSKLVLKKAESLEFLERWNESKIAYETLIKNGECSKTIMDGKNRCNKVLNPQKNVKPRNNNSQSEVNRKSASTASEKLQRVKEFGDQKKREENEKFQLHDKVEAKLESWRKGNEDNIRALICSLDTILWPELNWKPIKLTDLVMDNKVKINYMKAVAKTHPDKIASSESTENKMIANGVFITLNEAWEKFKANKGL